MNQGASGRTVPDFDITVEAGDWPGEAELSAQIEGALNATLPHLETALPEGAELSFLFTDDDTIADLNGQWRGKQKPTNVLSFAANEGGGPVTPLLGDVVLAAQTVAREAREQEKPLPHHITHLVVHGFLHLLGYDHETAQEAEDMEALEIRILADLSITNPYTEPLLVEQE